MDRRSKRAAETLNRQPRDRKGKRTEESRKRKNNGERSRKPRDRKGKRTEESRKRTAKCHQARDGNT